MSSASTTGTTTITASSHPPSSSGTTITTVTGAGASILPPGPPPITGDQFAKLMDAIQASQARMDTKLADFQYQVCRSQDEAAAKAVKKSRSAEAPYQYKKKGNEAQAKFNSEVEDAVQEAMDELEGESRPSQSVERAKAALEKGAKKIAERQKLIKLADRSDFGWSVVTEYTADELADNSEDEKRIEKAEKAAEKKSVKRRKVATPAKQPRSVATPSSSVSSATQVPRRPGLIPAVANSRPLGPCFTCGEIGHLHSFCPRREGQALSGKKWYPSRSVRCVSSSINASSGDGSSTDSECVVDELVDDIDEPHVDRRTWEAEAVSPDCCDMSVQGRLKERIQFWREVLKAPSTVLNTIESGYVLPLKSEPTPNIQCNQQSAIVNADFVQQSVSELIKQQVLR